MDVVSFETAKRLKNAGYPQQIKNGSTLYSKSGAAYIVSDSLKTNSMISVCGFELCGLQQIEESDFFAPTATDILREIQEALLTYLPESSDWMCFEYDEWDNLMPWKFAHQNPAEACALAWLELNKKQE